jgi:hypothetical protein
VSLDASVINVVDHLIDLIAYDTAEDEVLEGSRASIAHYYRRVCHHDFNLRLMGSVQRHSDVTYHVHILNEGVDVAGGVQIGLDNFSSRISGH